MARARPESNEPVETPTSATTAAVDTRAKDTEVTVEVTVDEALAAGLHRVPPPLHGAARPAGTGEPSPAQPATVPERDELLRTLGEPFEQDPSHAARALRYLLNETTGGNSRVLTRGDVEAAKGSDDLRVVALAIVVEKHFLRWSRLMADLDSMSR